MSQERRGAMEIKVYIVLQRNNVAKPGEPNERIIGTRLTRAAADDIVALNPGTRVERHVATK